MASRYILGIGYSKDHGKKVYRKYHKQRPLGELERKYQILQEQPMLLHDTVDYDTGANWSYHSMQSKSVSSFYHDKAGRPQQNSAYSRGSGSDSGYSEKPAFVVSNGHRSETRPNSCPVAFNNSNKDRKLTTGKHKKNKPLYKLKVNYDQDFLSAQETCKKVNQKIYHHKLDSRIPPPEGVASHSETSSSRHLESRSESWLGLPHHGSSVSEISNGCSGQSGEFFAVEGPSRKHVARRVGSGDSVRIGRNGNLVDVNLESPRSSVDEMLHDAEEEKRKKTKEVVPLCWHDAIAEPKTKVIVPRTTKEHKASINQNRSKPVQFEKFETESTNSVPIIRNKGYRIIHKDKPRMPVKNGMAGPFLGVTKSILIGREDDEIKDGVNYEQIVSDHIQKHRTSKARKSVEKKEVGQMAGKELGQMMVKESQGQIAVDLASLQPKEYNCMPTPSNSMIWSSDSRPGSVKYRSESRTTHTMDTLMESRAPSVMMSIPRPHTAASTSSSFINTEPDPNLSIIQPGSKPRQKREGVRSPIKPTSAKHLHKSGSLLGGRTLPHGVSTDTYIQITQQIVLPKSVNTVENHHMSYTKADNNQKVPTDAITMVTRHNSSDYQHYPPSPMPSQKTGYFRTNTPVSHVTNINRLDVNFNSVLIPTAESSVGSDLNSLSEFSDHDINLVDADIPADFEYMDNHDDIHVSGHINNQSQDPKINNSETKEEIPSQQDNASGIISETYGEEPHAEYAPCPNAIPQAPCQPDPYGSIMSESNVERTMTPQEELRRLRVEIKTNLQKTQQDAQEDFQNLFLGQYD